MLLPIQEKKKKPPSQKHPCRFAFHQMPNFELAQYSQQFML